MFRRAECESRPFIHVQVPVQRRCIDAAARVPLQDGNPIPSIPEEFRDAVLEKNARTSCVITVVTRAKLRRRQKSRSAVPQGSSRVKEISSQAAMTASGARG